jgi:hypothetical protein
LRVLRRQALLVDHRRYDGEVRVLDQPGGRSAAFPLSPLKFLKLR